MITLHLSEQNAAMICDALAVFNPDNDGACTSRDILRDMVAVRVAEYRAANEARAIDEARRYGLFNHARNRFYSVAEWHGQAFGIEGDKPLTFQTLDVAQALCSAINDNCGAWLSVKEIDQ